MQSIHEERVSERAREREEKEEENGRGARFQLIFDF